MSGPQGWAVPEAVTDPGWTQRPTRPRLGLVVVGVLLVAAVCAGGVFAVTSWPSTSAVPVSPAPGIVGVTISSDPPSRPAPAVTVSRSATRRPTARPARPAPATSSRPFSQPRPGGTPRPTATAPRPAPTTPAPVSTRPAGGTPIPVTQTASQSIACDAGTTVTARGSADRPGALTLTGGGSSRTATGANASASMPATASATYTASMRGINPHVAVSCS